MNRRIILSVGGATAGLLTTTFLPIGVAFADNGTIGDVGSTALLGSTALPSTLAGTAPLGDTGAITPNADTLNPTTLPDTSGTSPLGDTGGLGSITPTAGTTEPGDTAPAAGDSFTIGDTTFNPVQDDGSEGFNPVTTLFSAPPFLQAGDADQSFDVTSGTGSDATDLGTVTTSENVSNLFGVHNTEFTITDVDPAGGASDSDLPAVGTVYDVANFGNGFENIYTDIPGADGGSGTITDTLVTPFGDFNIPTDFDAAALLDPGDAFTGLSAVGADAAAGATDAASSAADAAGGAADAASGAADAAGGAADLASSIDPSSLLGF